MKSEDKFGCRSRTYQEALVDSRYNDRIEKIFFEVDENKNKVKDINAGRYYVNRFKNGISDFDPLTGGEAKVLHLEDFFLVKREKRQMCILIHRTDRKNAPPDVRLSRACGIYGNILHEIKRKKI